MQKYEVLVKSYLNDREVYPGEVVEYAGKAGTNLRLITPKEKPLKQMARAELLEYAAAHDVTLKDPDNMKDEDIAETIREKVELDLHNTTI